MTTVKNEEVVSILNKWQDELIRSAEQSGDPEFCYEMAGMLKAIALSLSSSTRVVGIDVKATIKHFATLSLISPVANKRAEAQTLLRWCEQK